MNAIHQAFWNWAESYFGDQIDKIDIEHQYDRALTVEENITLFKQAYPKSATESASEAAKKLRQEQPQYTRTATIHQQGLSWATSKTRCYYILGGKGSGKTALGHHIADSINLPVWVFRHPRPDLLPENYYCAYDLGQIERVRDCVFWIDEPQLHLPSYDKRNNDALQRMITIARHRNVHFIITTCDARAVNKGIEALFDVVIVLDIDPFALKNGSTPKNLIKKNALSIEGWRLEKGEGLIACRDRPDKEGRFTYQAPQYYSDELSKAYR